jgi:hypothetical protein
MKVAWTARERTRLAEIHDYIPPYRIIYEFLPLASRYLPSNTTGSG